MNNETSAVRVLQPSELGLEVLSEKAIRDFYQPARAYRISQGKYPAGARFPGAHRAGVWFVLAGRGELFSPTSTVFQAGQVVEFPDGGFELAVLGETDLELIAVWRLPEEFWAPE